MTKSPVHRIIPALRVRQWQSGWDKVAFDPSEHRSRPLEHFFLTSIPAKELRSLSGIARRQAKNASPRANDLGIQRQHEPERSSEISRFVEFGFPWSTLSESKRKSADFHDLRKPGWLPTAIVVNILQPEDLRNELSVAENDLIRLNPDSNSFSLPYEKWLPTWQPVSLPPLEVIDGQHRLWAFDSSNPRDDFDLPVVAFFGLDVSWQAYLFWTINIKPKRINPSLAFDLYPLLRAEDWLDRGEGHSIYRETRSQELTETLWAHQGSPWYDRINMLGEKLSPWVSQSAWIKSLMATMVRPWEGRSSKIGGLFGSRLKEDGEVLGWSRAQQAAFLIFGWQALLSAFKASSADWAQNLRQLSNLDDEKPKDDASFYGSHTLINTDQGVRGYLHILNDIVFLLAAPLKLNQWELGENASANDTEAVTRLVSSLGKQPVAQHVAKLATHLAQFDWRTSSTPGLSEDLRRSKLVFRGSGGYKEIRTQLLEKVAEVDDEVGALAKRLLAPS